MGISKLFQVLIVVFQVGCTSLFYQPDRFMYMPPEKLNLEYEQIKFEAEGKVPLVGWYFKTKRKKPKSFILFFHGNAQNITSHYLNLHWIPKEGHEFFIFDYRGYGLSGIVPALFGKGERQIKPNRNGVYKDSMAALNKGYELFKQSGAEKFIVYGQSLGGAIVQRALEDFEHKNDVDLVILDSTFISYQNIAFDKLWGAWLFKPLSPLAYILVSDEFSSTKFLQENKTPLLVIHGKKDFVIPFKFGEKIFAKAKVSKKDFWIIEKGSHIDVFSRHENHYRKLFLEYLDKL
ncbi:MAG: alpha/beta hydrolase [Bacteriovoracaceae bacterium]|nr:alpha/beta hydrolase [Bacteriovoracaceae bacterium]